MALVLTLEWWEESSVLSRRSSKCRTLKNEWSGCVTGLLSYSDSEWEGLGSSNVGGVLHGQERERRWDPKGRQGSEHVQPYKEDSLDLILVTIEHLLEGFMQGRWVKCFHLTFRNQSSHWSPWRWSGQVGWKGRVETTSSSLGKRWKQLRQVFSNRKVWEVVRFSIYLEAELRLTNGLDVDCEGKRKRWCQNLWLRNGVASVVFLVG